MASWKHGHGNRSHLSNRTNYDAEAGGGMFLRADDALDSEINSLRSKISMLKQVSSDIGQEVDLRHKVILELELAMEKASMAVRRTMRTVTRMYHADKSSKHMYLLLFFVFGIFLMVYFWNKVSRLLGSR